MSPARPSAPLSPRLLALALGLLAPAVAQADPRDSPAHPGESINVMNQLARHGLHDQHDERWSIYGQFTWISSFKLPFQAQYSNLNGTPDSLRTDFEHSFTGTLSLYAGLRLWPGAELYVAPEVITSQPLSGLTGLGGTIQNFELQKQGSVVPTPYLSRVYLRQTIRLGGAVTERGADAMQLGAHVDARRVVITVGNFSVLDLFDRNAYAGDLRRQFFNMAFLTHSAFDFAADARGYTWGAVVELYFDRWAVRVGHAIVPVNPNQLALDFRFWEHFGEQLELEHSHSIGGLPGAVRVLAYRNQEVMGRFDDALAALAANPAHNAASCTAFSYGSPNATAPDLCWARRPNVKTGVGINLEQSLGHGLGVFARAMYSDGGSEVYSYTSADRSFSVGALARGALWHRPFDYAGIGFGAGFISASHAEYLRRGGVDGFVGDGNLTAAVESAFETFYGVHLASSIWLSGDYQFIANPGFNAARGPVHVLGARLHAEF